ncbi:ABC transporter substrate-binding protein [Paenibacillus prosopidis]|uniref:Carbohydrate ABC transporter substrate-binding protein (CUT1 family) n=1 Tax=Paenibacillus prosopidis TaxID=630520 RepID=A0A368W2K4_9BACL|nr:ABC transporter substrate-binding protein [Paenibacillus prosopidis]RCW47498.1 carbohydrate ABC transporter substrate-binding protein (CUT1 family) [Paenibacillus prosopidis]
MKRKFSWISAILVMLLLLSACNANTSSNEGASPSTSGGASNSSGTALEPYELTMAYFTFGSVPKDQLLIEEALNKITIAKLNTTVKLLPISFGAWQNQINLMLTSNEKLDLMAIFGNTYANQVAKGQLTELDDLLANQGKGIVEALGAEYANAAKINGKTYAVPTIRDLAQKYGFYMPKTLVDKYNLNLSQVKTLDDLEPILKTIKEKEPKLIPLVNSVSSSPITSFNTRDSLGDDMGVLLNNGQDLKVVNWFETEEYATVLKKMREWYLAGYIAKDAVTVKESKSDIFKAGKGAGTLAAMKPGFDVQEARQSGTPIVSVEMLPPVAKTSTVTNVMWGIAKNSKNPERAMQFLNLMYTDKEIINLLDWGIEGKHYVKVSENVIDYPQGVTASDVGYSGLGWLFGNQFLSYIFKGDDEKLWEKMKEFNTIAIKSKALGFTFDSTSVKTEFAAVTNVMTQYRIALECGALDPDKSLPEFIKKLKDAGIDKIINEKQKQLDAWAATNGK